MNAATTETMNGSFGEARTIGRPGTALRATLAALAIAGCGQSAGPDYRPPLASVQGTITGATVPITGEVRVAVMWLGLWLTGFADDGGIDLDAGWPGFAGDGGIDLDAGWPGFADDGGMDADAGLPAGLPFRRFTTATKDVPLVPKFPARFRIDLDRVPPLEVLPRAEEFGYSIGTIFVYEDRNGNGRLDVDAVTDVNGADRFLGAPRGVSLLYLENRSGVPLPTGTGMPIGFSLGRQQVADEPPPPCTEPAPPPPKSEVLPIDTPIEIALDGGGFPLLLCGAEGAFQLVCDPHLAEKVKCNADGSGWLTFSRVAVGTICEQLVPSCTSQVCPPPVARPDFCK